MTLEEIETVRYGDPYKIRVSIGNRSGQNRTLTVLVKSSSVYNNGVTGHLIRKSAGEFTWPAGKRMLYFIHVSIETHFCFSKGML